MTSSTSAKPAEVPQSFNSVSNLFEFSQSALKSKSESLVYEGYIASRECSGVASLWDELSKFSAGATTSKVTGALSPERQLAIQALGAKCSGFMSIGLQKSRDLSKQLRGRADQLGGYILRAEKDLDAESTAAGALNRLVFSGSPAALEAGLMQLSVMWAKANGIETSDERVLSMGIASMLATCDLGKDCSTQSYSSQLRCALSGQCNQNLFDDWTEGLTDQQIKQVETYRKAINAAVIGRDLSALGIKGS